MTEEEHEKYCDDLWRRYHAKFREDVPLAHYSYHRIDLFRVMERAIKRGRPVTEEELGGAYPPGALV